MKKAIPAIYFVLCFISIGILSLCWFGSNDIYDRIQRRELTPYKMEQISEDETDYWLDLSAYAYNGIDLAFYTSHQYVEVFADGKRLYRSKVGKPCFGTTSGSVWNIIEIPYGKKIVEVKVTALYDEVRDPDITFYGGQGMAIYRELMAEDMPAILTSLLGVVLGGYLIVYWFIIRKKVFSGKNLLYLGIFAFLFGAWSYGETNAATLLITNRVANSFMEFLCLMLMGIPFVLFTREFMRVGDKKIWKIICVFSILNFLVCMTLQLLGIKNLRETILSTHIILVVSVMYLVGNIIYKIIKKQFDRVLRMSIIGMLLIGVTVTGGLIWYYKSLPQAQVLARLSFLCFILLLGSEAASYTSRMIDKGRKAQIYEEMATVDALTGQLNRNAYDQMAKETVQNRDMMIVTFDLNNLKKCNDSMGHIFGDKYITQAAHMINKVFSRYGYCYRIGGDEFCVVVKNAYGCPIELLLEKLQNEQDRWNAQSADIYIQIASGYAVFDENLDHDLESLRCRADARMYENKKNLKTRKIV